MTTTTHTLDSAAAAIQAWDKQDVRDLREMLRTARELDADAGGDGQFIDMSALPTAPIPEDVDTSYPVWALDEQGYALVGDDADQIETLDQVRANS